MKYEVRIIPSAEREMDKLPTPVHTRLSKRILSLEGRTIPDLGG
jgi:mRNA-degrading endonuclease RelE of RelBE toxin-antitoxin system